MKQRQTPVFSVSSSYTPHEPIEIRSNEDFAMQGWPGSGFQGDPYIIEGLNITSDRTGISISDTTVHFEIVGCLIVSNTTFEWGISFRNVTQGSILDNTIKKHKPGIRLSSSQNCTAVNNTITGKLFGGLSLIDSTDCTIKNNMFTGNGLYVTGASLPEWTHDITGNTVNGGVIGYFVSTASMFLNGADYGQLILANCSDIVISGGTFFNVSIGVQLSFCRDALVANSIFENVDTAMGLFGSTDCVIENNTARSSFDGFHLEKSPECTLQDNTVDDSVFGFYVYESYNCSFAGNTATAGYAGFYLDGSNNSSIYGNSFNEGFYGIQLRNSSHAILTNNVAERNSRGFSILYSIDCNLTGNILEDNGIYLSGDRLSHWLHQVSNNTINRKALGYFRMEEDISVDGSQYGQIILAGCNESVIENGVFVNATTGVQIGFSIGITLRNNTAAHNPAYGFRVVRSRDCDFLGNTAMHNNGGFYLSHCNAIILRNNTSHGNTNSGFSLWRSNNNTIIANSALNNTYYGVGLSEGVNNILYLNRLGNNLMANGYDGYGGPNDWDNGTHGNYWSDYNGEGVYEIPGSSDSVDHHPYLLDTITPSMNNPSDMEYEFGTTGHNISWHPRDENPQSFEVYQNGSLIRSGTWNGSNIIIYVDNLEVGVYNFTLVVYDRAGNFARDMVIVKVIPRIIDPLLLATSVLVFVLMVVFAVVFVKKIAEQNQ
jgi:parallel beta-helix repeat protein